MARSLEDLIDSKEPGWPLVQGWLKTAKNQVEVLTPTARGGADVLLAMQVTTRSPMGAIAFETNGLLADHGWLRLFGGAGPRMEGDLARWNGLGPRPLVEAFEGALLVAHDAIGGFFALDGGALGDGKGHTFYLAPDTLEWQPLGFGYSGLVQFAFNGDLQKFYGEFRWEGWEKEVSALSPDRGVHFYPPLYAEAETRSRKDVPMTELLAQNLEAAP